MQTPNYKFSKRLIVGLSAVSLSVAVISGLFTQVQAQSQTVSRDQPSSTSISPIVRFEPVDDRPLDDSRGGASRPTDIKCSRDESYHPAMTPLLPASKQGLTSTPRPTFWVYIPQTSAPQAHFTLKDENNQGVYQALIPITKTGEIVSVSLPENQPPLEVGKTYQWSVALICQPTQTDIPIVSGKVRRVKPDSALGTQLGKSTSLEQAASYGQAGMWYDMVNSLAQLRKTQSADSTIAANWVHLLNSVGLEDIATKPLQ